MQNPLLVCCHPRLTSHIFLIITNHQPLFSICLTLLKIRDSFCQVSTSSSSISIHLILHPSQLICHFLWLHFHHLSFLRSFTLGLRLISYTNLFTAGSLKIVFKGTGLESDMVRFICVPVIRLYFYFLLTCGRLSCTLNSIVSYSWCPFM